MIDPTILDRDSQSWQYPEFQTREYFSKRNKYCLCIFVLNEHGRLQSQLKKMAPITSHIDIIIADGGSTDECASEENTIPFGVRAVLIKKGPGKLGAQMRMAFAYALNQGYDGVITVDGNDKDDIIGGLEGFIKNLDQGFDHIQGSRFIPGGYHKNTPLLRLLGVRFLHAPLLSLASGCHYTDTTNGFRAYSKKLLTNRRITDEGSTRSHYDLHYYLAMNGNRDGFQTTETPVSRVYPKQGSVPTKIIGWRSNLSVLLTLFREAVTPGLELLGNAKVPMISFLLAFAILSDRFILNYTHLTTHPFSDSPVGAVVLNGLDASLPTPYLLLRYFSVISALLISLSIHLRLPQKSKNIPDHLSDSLGPIGLLSSSLFIASVLVPTDSGLIHEGTSIFLMGAICLGLLLFLTLFPYSRISRAAPNRQHLLFSGGGTLSFFVTAKLIFSKSFSVHPLEGLFISISTLLGSYLLSLTRKKMPISSASSSDD